MREDDRWLAPATSVDTKAKILRDLIGEVIQAAAEKGITVSEAKELVQSWYPGSWNEPIRKMIEGISI